MCSAVRRDHRRAGTVGEKDEDERLRAERKDKKVSAILHSGYPIRYWDHDLGPDVPHLLSGTLGDASQDEAVTDLVDLTSMPGPALREANYALSEDGTFVVTSWTVPGPTASIRTILVRIDTETGNRTTLVDDPAADLSNPVISPSGEYVVFSRSRTRLRTVHLDSRCTATASRREPWRTWHRAGTAGPLPCSGYPTARGWC